MATIRNYSYSPAVHGSVAVKQCKSAANQRKHLFDRQLMPVMRYLCSMDEEIQKFVIELTGFVNRMVDSRFKEIASPLEAEVKLVKSLISEWVDTKEAMRLTGVKQAETLKAERERRGTLIEYKLEGISPRYLRSSLVAYSERKVRRRVSAQSPPFN
jgi:hypothetical protein